MQDTLSRLPLVFGFAASLVTASLQQTAELQQTGVLMRTAAMTSPTPTTMVTMMSANPNITITMADLEVTVTMTSTNPNATVTMNSANPNVTVTMMFPDPSVTESPVETFIDPIPTTSPNLSVIYDSKVASPTPGSFGILNGIPTRMLNDTIKETTHILADTLPVDNPSFYQPWNTSYPGPIHDGDWAKYLQIWDPVWWSSNLDSVRQTSCTCSAEDFYTNPQAQLAAYMNFEYYSQKLGNVYSFDWVCGPTQSAMSISHRITSGKGLSEHCWAMAGGDDDDSRNKPMKEWFCDPAEELCVKPWRDGSRELKFHDHKRNYDRHGVHTWSEIHQVVADVCEPICRDSFLMKYDDFSHHNPSFVTTFWPPKPIDLTIIGD
ncbi:MAG: hypothetical protein Q9161_008372 [Pseudevernia consocians]